MSKPRRDNLVSISEAARLCGISRVWVQRLIKMGKVHKRTRTVTVEGVRVEDVQAALTRSG